MPVMFAVLMAVWGIFLAVASIGIRQYWRGESPERWDMLPAYLIRGLGVGYVAGWLMLITAVLGQIGIRSGTDNVVFICVLAGFVVLLVAAFALDLSLALFSRPSWAMPRWLREQVRMDRAR